MRDRKLFCGLVIILCWVCVSQICFAQNQKLQHSAAPTFELVNYNGIKYSLADAKGKVIVLDFWASWCAPCIKAFPAMIQVQNSYSSSNDVVFWYINTFEVSGKTSASILDFLEKKGVKISFVQDQDGSVAEAFGITALPVKIIIDKLGVIRYMGSGFSGDTEEFVNDLTAEIERIR